MAIVKREISDMGVGNGPETTLRALAESLGLEVLSVRERSGLFLKTVYATVQGPEEMVALMESSLNGTGE